MLPTQNDILKDVRRALEEDLGDGDVSAALLPQALMAEAEIISREPMLICGQPWVEAVFAEVDPTIHCEWLCQEGEWLNAPATLCRIGGPAASILTAERTALNFLQVLSGTATQVRQYLLKLEGTNTQLLDTRKTIPGLRLAQKYAVACAGGNNHRMGLYDAFLIKENHIKSCGSISKAIQRAREIRKDLMVEVEVENLRELQEALAARPDRILLDNFSLDELMEAVKLNNRSCELEASGGVELSTITSIAQTGVNYISVGAMTKSIHAIDLSLLVREIK
ncbi:carboxylating nicotinate-nucleotide diphosphorylase [Legionella jordanis]|uniref:Probable nicotinate-nucleotide pyrophosphorylase [carboxylating] n=1 Tax=Legionella jordanis TaxID=456 RepID=A0A0W0VFW0_9GAMM|nr:carboxylating nicotinate-nucleotide diphosphorylase [Legionella jordanis]KTD18923.1 nicotinate-nucleotide pyrophosphorylase [Legionella jordanis]RMX05513.1 carboxylating nicotinate-nucleotide diphosphorylase [Legionella jordanis]RMX19198.1 carboxylating nicotinate-nucleotide diphosphorylase [Legionella jordanis]VEH13023.1 nicotinate-nucleotide pyrophosphorylase [Legionella jordanis]HAT8714066.1 carboxylating nicotinate-nucleotide diphosphorylase [Legionella jordanis]